MSVLAKDLRATGKLLDAGDLSADVTSSVLDMEGFSIAGLELVSSVSTFPNTRTTFVINLPGLGCRYVRVRYDQASAIVVIEESCSGVNWDRIKDADGNESYALASAGTLTVWANRKRY